MEIGDIVWDVVVTWDWLMRKHPGGQYTEAAGSISASISEGYGRFYYKETRYFCFVARGSLLKTGTWTNPQINK